MEKMDSTKKNVSFDSLYDLVGHFGIYQFMLFLLLGLMSFTENETTFMNFVGYTPDYWCRTEELENYSFETQKNVSVPIKEYNSKGEPVFATCQVYGLNYSAYTEDDFLHWQRDVEIANDTAQIACPHGYVYDRAVFQQSMTTKWDLVCGDGWMVQFVGTMSFLGFLLASLLLGPLSDRYGRRPGLAFFVVIKVAGSFVSAYAPNYPVLVVARIVLSAGSLGCYVLAFSLLQELVGPGYRTVVGVGYAAMYSVGFMMTAVIGYFVRDDVNLQVIMAAMSSVLIPALWVIPESPRWMLLNNRLDDAEKVLRKMAAINRRVLPDDFSIKQVTVSCEPENKASVLVIFKTPVLRKRTIILCLHWFTDSLIFFALSMNTAALSGSVFLNTFLIGAVEIPANIIAVFVMNWRRIGRRWTSCLSLLLAGGSSLLCVPILLSNVNPMVVTVLSLVGKAGATMGFNCIFVYTAELYPTEVRNMGFGVCSFAARMSGMLAPYIGGPLAAVWLPLPSIIFGSFGIAAGAVVSFLPETLGTALPDVIEDLEDKTSRLSKDKGNSQTGASNQMVTPAYINEGYETKF